MHHLIIFLLSLLTITHSCPDTRDMLLRCFKRLLDKNNNNAISRGELDEFIKNSQCIPGREWEPYITGKLIIDTCDLDGDGILTLLDWGNHNSCINSKDVVKRMCEFCEYCK